MEAPNRYGESVKIWKLERSHGDYSLVEAFMVRAESEGRARALAANHDLNETGSYYSRRWGDWLDTEKSTCAEVLVEGPSEVVLVAYNHG